MVVQSRSGGASFPPWAVDVAYVKYSANLRWMFSVSPRAVGLGLTALKPVSYPSVVNGGQALNDGIPAFGLVCRAGGVRPDRVAAAAQRLAAGAAVGLGRRAGAGTDAEDRHPRLRARRPGLARRAGLGGHALHLVRAIPGLAGFREAARITLLALVPAALLAGAAVDRCGPAHPR